MMVTTAAPASSPDNHDKDDDAATMTAAPPSLDVINEAVDTAVLVNLGGELGDGTSCKGGNTTIK